MKKILMTAFEPFGKITSNSSLEVVKKIPHQVDNYTIIKETLPVVYGNLGVYLELLEKHQPDYILLCGQSGRSEFVEIEQVAINMMYADISDNENVIKKGEKIFPDGHDAYFTNIPIINIVDQLQNLPIRISFSAGAYICNLSYYATLYYIKEKNLSTKAIFIHFPYYTNQVKNSGKSQDIDILVDILLNIIKLLEN